MSRKRTPQTGLSDKIRSSMVLKLNLRILGVLLVAFFMVNVLISVLFCGITLWKAEIGARNILDHSDMIIAGEYPGLQAYVVSIADGRELGPLFPSWLQKRLPLATLNVERVIKMPTAVSLSERLEQAVYIMQVPAGGVTYRIVYTLGEDIQLFYFLMLVVLGFELFYFLGRVKKNTRTIRKTLKPLSEMAATARSLHENVTARGVSAHGADLKHLAGAISDIDVQKLNKHIAIDSSQNELKDLAYAINDMLKRISQSYESQVRFVSDASHELRTPISVIQGYVGLLDRWGKHDEKTLEESINAIKSETENMKVLVEQLLFLARGDNDTIQLHREIFDSCMIIEEIVKETCLIDPAHVYETDLDSPAYIDADQQLIKQAVRILVDNSIKYTPAGEKIMLKVFKEKGTVNIQVQDNGMGIEPEDVPRIFDRFYRSDESRDRKTGGSGLGLSIAKWIVERHEGHFAVISRLEIGTRITLILPAAE